MKLDKRYWKEFVDKGTYIESVQRYLDSTSEKKKKDPSFYIDKKVIFKMKERVDPRLVLFNTLVFSFFMIPFIYIIGACITFEPDIDTINLVATYCGLISGYLFLPLLFTLLAFIMRKDYTLLEGGILVIQGQKMRSYDGKQYVSKSIFLMDIEKVEKVILLSQMGGLRKPFLNSGDLTAYSTMKQYLIKLNPNFIELPPYTGFSSRTGKMFEISSKTSYDLCSRYLTVPRYVLNEIDKTYDLEIELPKKNKMILPGNLFILPYIQKPRGRG